MSGRKSSAASFNENQEVDNLYIQFELRNDGDNTNIPDPKPLRLPPTTVVSRTATVTPPQLEDQYAVAPIQPTSHRRFLGRSRKSAPPVQQPRPTPQPKQVVTQETIPRALGTYVDSVIVYIPFRLKGYLAEPNLGGGTYDSDLVKFAPGTLDFLGRDLRSHLFPSTGVSTDGGRDGSQCWTQNTSSVSASKIIQVPGLKLTWHDGIGPFAKQITARPARRSSIEKDTSLQRSTSVSSIRSTAASVTSIQRRGSNQSLSMQQVQYHVKVGKAVQGFEASMADTYSINTYYNERRSNKKFNGYTCVIPFTFSARNTAGEVLGFSKEALKSVKVSAICHMLRMCESTKVRARSATISGNCVFSADVEGCKWEDTSKQLTLFRKNSDSS